MKKRIVLLFLLAGIAVASFLAGSRFGRVNPTGNNAVPGRQVLYYVDPMNPSHTSDKPGLAPCGMKMEPVYADAGPSAANGPPLLPGSVHLSPGKQQLIGVQVAPAEKKSLHHALRLPGKVAADETRVFRVVAAAEGSIASVRHPVAGTEVKKDETLATFYTPAFVSAAQTLFSAMGYQDQVPTNLSPLLTLRTTISQNNLRQYRDSLRNLGVGNLQIEEMIRTRRLPEDVNIVSPADGFIMSRNVSLGQRFERGAELYRIADLSRVWVLADVFEREMGLISPEAQMKVTLPSQGKVFPGILSKTLSQFDNATRTLKLRFEVENPELALKPDMFVDAEVAVRLPETLVVPTEAVLDAGLRKTVFVDRGNGFFEPRSVQTGMHLGSEVQILHGLMAGERIVVSGNFLLDSESRMKLAAAGVQSAPTQDPVCGMAVDEANARVAGRSHEYSGKTYLFCNDGCKEEFVANPEKFLKPAGMPSAAFTNAVPHRDQPHH